MTVIEAINRIDSLKPNNFGQEDKIAWLSKLDGVIKVEIIDKHDGGDDIEFNGYTEEDLDKELIVRAPYDDVYLYWLEAQIDYYNNEIVKFNKSQIMFNRAYESFANYYNRSNMPKSTRIKYF